MIQKLIEQIQAKNAPVVVGLDPNLAFIPGFLLEEAARNHAVSGFGSEALDTAAEAVWQFNKRIVDAVCDLVPAVKPQIAMYEQFGIPGLMAYYKTIRYCREKGLIIIGYLGTDGIKPFIDVCNARDKGIFVLVKTSNPSSGEFQDVLTQEGRPVYELVGQKVNEWGALSMEGKYSNVGAVVGATYPEQGRLLRQQMPHTFILAPGYGAQGATGRDLSYFFDEEGLGAIVNSSRGIIAAWQKDSYSRYGETGFAEAARAAALDMIEDLRSAIAER